MDGHLLVSLLPLEANGQWRFPWELGWHNSGDTVSNLVAGNYALEFRSLSGYLVIETNFVVAVTNGGTTCVTNFYYPTLPPEDTNTATLVVNITPNAPGGSGWRFLGESAWRPPSSSATDLLPDIYFIEFAPVGGYGKPASRSVQVNGGSATVVSANYLLAQSPPQNVMLPVAVPRLAIMRLAPEAM